MSIIKATFPRLCIEGLDEVLDQKLRTRQNILLLGPPFSGKTTLGLQFLVSGLKSGEAAIIVTTTDTPEGFRTRAVTFDWDLLAFEDKGLLRYVDAYSPIVGLSEEDSSSVLRAGMGEQHLEKISLMVAALISDSWRADINVRLLFDNLSTLFFYNDLLAIARFMHVFLGRMKTVRATSLLILESGIHDAQAENVIRSLCDGVIELTNCGERRYVQGTLGGGFLRRIPVEISDNGLRVANATKH